MIFNIRHTHRADRGTIEEQKPVTKTFDTEISQIGLMQGYNIGLKIGEMMGREKPFMVICSPQIRCLQTAEMILSGLDHRQI